MIDGLILRRLVDQDVAVAAIALVVLSIPFWVLAYGDPVTGRMAVALAIVAGAGSFELARRIRSIRRID